MPALLVPETAASPLAPGVLQAAGPLGRRPRGRTYLEKLTSFTILVFFKCSSEKFRSFRHVTLAMALPHLGPMGTSKLCRDVRKGQSPGLPAAYRMPLDCRGTAGNRSDSLSPEGRPVASQAAHPTQSHKGTGSLGFIAPTQEETGTHALAFLSVCSERLGAGPSSS